MKNRKIAQKLLKLHGVCLILLGLGNATASFIATKTELEGPFRFLYSNPFPEVGFLQAYLLAAVVGLTLLMGSKLEKFYVFDVIGILMHLIPPVALIAMYDQIVATMGHETIRLSISIHSTFICLELLALGLYFRGVRTHEAA